MPKRVKVGTLDRNETGSIEGGKKCQGGNGARYTDMVEVFSKRGTKKSAV